MGVAHTSPGSAFSSLRLPLALCPQIQRHRGLSALQRTALESRARRNNRLVPLGGSRVHACRSPRPQGQRSRRSEPSSRSFPQVPQERIVRGKAPPTSRQVTWSPTAPSQAPLSGWAPPRAFPFPISSPRFSLFVTSQRPLAILRAPLSLQELASL